MAHRESPSPVVKARLREEIWEQMASTGLSPEPHGTTPTFPGQNEAAERLRRLAIYRMAQAIMVPPDQTLFQVRINALADGKGLIMATPGLKDGFYRLQKGAIKFKDFRQAARSTGTSRFGRRLITSHQAIGSIDLLITGAVAVDLEGGRLGKGSGYFDLEYMILREIGSITETTPVVALVDDVQVREQVPMAEKDVALDIIVTPTRVITCERTLARPSGVSWKQLDEKTSRGMRPLKELGHKDAGNE